MLRWRWRGSRGVVTLLVFFSKVRVGEVKGRWLMVDCVNDEL